MPESSGLRAQLAALAGQLRSWAYIEGEVGGEDADDDFNESDTCDGPAECHAAGRMRAYHRAAMALEEILRAHPEE